MKELEVNSESDQVTAEDLRELTAAFNRRDLDAIMGYLTDDCVLTMPKGATPWGTRFEGASEVRQAFAERLAGLPDARWEDDEHWSCGERGASMWTLRATVPGRNERIEVRGCDLFSFERGRIKTKHSFWKIVEA